MVKTVNLTYFLAASRIINGPLSDMMYVDNKTRTSRIPARPMVVTDDPSPIFKLVTVNPVRFRLSKGSKDTVG